MLVGCSRGDVEALGGAACSLRDAAAQAPRSDWAICVAPSYEEQWDAVAELAPRRCVVVVNGLINNGRLPHAYYYKAMSAFSAQTGAVIRCFPGPYECYSSAAGEKLALEIGLAAQGGRALPDTKDAQMMLQNSFGSRRLGA